jgi:hypothetical protein
MRIIGNSYDFVLGLDLGQAADFTAFCILERATGGKLRLRTLERAPLKTPYPVIVDKLVALHRNELVKDRLECVVDATGVGRPVVDMMKRASIFPLRPVLITGGAYESQDTETGYWSVPKRVLVSRLAICLQEGRLEIAPRVKDGELLKREMAAFRAKINVRTQNETYEAWREKDHDDLVLAVALAVWWAERTRRVDPKSNAESIKEGFFRERAARARTKPLAKALQNRFRKF